ncbi:MAG: nucleotidyltransferase domain-containing protein [Candidatus Aenigmarchaeota archaeon]|nr:nucleotidyltransferase domain-containing protein [Candidatus Aenigmarchaeota archaeon]
MFKKMKEFGKIFGKTCIRILEFLAEAPSKSFYEKEIAKACRISAGAVNNHMRLLKSLDLVVHEKKGRASFYRINMDNFVAREVKTMFTAIMLHSLVEKLSPLSKKIILFGSCSEGTDTEESDIDLFVLSSDRENILRLIVEFEAEIGRKISPIIVDSKGLILVRERQIYKSVQRGRLLWNEKEHGV